MLAINRVHRIGQRKDTFVYRYLMRDTIEMNIFERRSQLSRSWNEKSLFSREELSIFVLGKEDEDEMDSEMAINLVSD